MAGVDGNVKAKTIIDYAPLAANAGIPAILRLTPAEPEQRTAGAMKVQIQATTLPLQATVNAQRAAYLKLIQPVQSVCADKGEPSEDAWIGLGIPRLKETLAALDSEMHSNTCSDVDRRMAVHERILQLQGANLSSMQKAVEQTVDSVKQLMGQHAQNDVASKQLRQTSALHANMHEATGKFVLQLDAKVLALRRDVADSTLQLQQTSDLHGKLHKASGAGVLGLRDDVEDLRQTCDLHSELHQASGAGVLRLHDKVQLHSELHKASGAGVLGLHKHVQDLRQTRDLHTQLHEASGANILGLHAARKDLQHTSDLHTQLHRVGGEHMLKQNVVGAETVPDGRVDELLRLRTDLDQLVKENDQLKASVAVHEELHRTTSSIVSSLSRKTFEAGALEAATLETCANGEPCAPHCRCTACSARDARSLRSTKACAAEEHARILSMLKTDIQSSNRPRPIRR
jgi:hypothetical protein